MKAPIRITRNYHIYIGTAGMMNVHTPEIIVPGCRLLIGQSLIKVTEIKSQFESIHKGHIYYELMFTPYEKSRQN